MKAGEVYPVVDDGDVARRRSIERLDLGLSATGDGDDVARRAQGEDPPLQMQEEPMLRIYLNPGPPHGAEIGAVASLPRPVDVLLEGPLVALDQVVAARPRRPPGGQREEEVSQRGGLAQHGKPLDGDARRGKLCGGGEEMKVVAAALHEGVHEAGRRGLDASVKREGTADQGELHRCPVSFSTRGKSARRAASKL